MKSISELCMDVCVQMWVCFHVCVCMYVRVSPVNFHRFLLHISRYTPESRPISHLRDVFCKPNYAVFVIEL